MAYKHCEIETVQTPRDPEAPCGDVVEYDRTGASTVVVLCDGLGSGIKAHLMATFCCARLLENLRQGASLRESFARMALMIGESKSSDNPFYAAVSAARVLNDGSATVLSYEAPAALFVGRNSASVLRVRTLTAGSEIIGETHCHLAHGESLLLTSDGITQAGLGQGLALGWESEGVRAYINDCLAEGFPAVRLPSMVHTRARQLWGGSRGDDCTVTMLTCRPGNTVNIFTGPPASRDSDFARVRDFSLAEGVKVVCGATTARIVARGLERELEVRQDQNDSLAPPSLEIEGIDLVTEGLVTLNQTYNILSEDPGRYEKDSGVSGLCELLLAADRVHFTVGAAHNPANEHISFRQLGLLGRQAIVNLIGDKLRKMGKLVVVDYV
jgi:hypothetical protein